MQSALRLQCRTYGQRIESVVLKLALGCRVLRSKEMSLQGERKKDRKKTEQNERKISEENIQNTEGSKCDFGFCWQWPL